MSRCTLLVQEYERLHKLSGTEYTARVLSQHEGQSHSKLVGPYAPTEQEAARFPAAPAVAVVAALVAAAAPAAGKVPHARP